MKAPIPTITEFYINTPELPRFMESWPEAIQRTGKQPQCSQCWEESRPVTHIFIDDRAYSACCRFPIYLMLREPAR